jgi:hypothetical protein
VVALYSHLFKQKKLQSRRYTNKNKKKIGVCFYKKYYKTFLENQIACLHLIWHGSHRKRRIQQLFYRCVAAVMILPGRCLATIGGYTYRHRDWWEGFMKYVTDMGSGTMIYILSFIKIGSGIRKLIRGIHRHTDTKRALWFLYFIHRAQGSDKN